MGEGGGTGLLQAGEGGRVTGGRGGSRSQGWGWDFAGHSRL